VVLISRVIAEQSEFPADSIKERCLPIWGRGDVVLMIYSETGLFFLAFVLSYWIRQAGLMK